VTDREFVIAWIGSEIYRLRQERAGECLSDQDIAELNAEG